MSLEETKPVFNIDDVKFKIAELQKSLEQNLPGYSLLLKQIHGALSKQPELTYMLGDEKIAVIIGGLEKFHKKEITETKDKKKVSKNQGKLINEDMV